MGSRNYKRESDFVRLKACTIRQSFSNWHSNTCMYEWVFVRAWSQKMRFEQKMRSITTIYMYSWKPQSNSNETKNGESEFHNCMQYLVKFGGMWVACISQSLYHTLSHSLSSCRRNFNLGMVKRGGIYVKLQELDGVVAASAHHFHVDGSRCWHTFRYQCLGVRLLHRLQICRSIDGKREREGERLQSRRRHQPKRVREKSPTLCCFIMKSTCFYHSQVR